MHSRVYDLLLALSWPADRDGDRRCAQRQNTFIQRNEQVGDLCMCAHKATADSLAPAYLTAEDTVILTPARAPATTVRWF